MERKRFRFDISNNNVQAVMAKRQRRFGGLKQQVASDDKDDKSKLKRTTGLGSVQHIKSIPSEMLPARKYRKDCVLREEYDKPEHWVMPEKVVRPARQDVYQIERDNITKLIDRRQSWCRAARCLISASGTPKSQKTDNGGKIGPIKRSVPIE